MAVVRMTYCEILLEARINEKNCIVELYRKYEKLRPNDSIQIILQYRR